MNPWSTAMHGKPELAGAYLGRRPTSKHNVLMTLDGRVVKDTRLRYFRGTLCMDQVARDAFWDALRSALLSLGRPSLRCIRGVLSSAFKRYELSRQVCTSLEDSSRQR